MRTRVLILDALMLLVIVIFALSVGMLIARCATRGNLYEPDPTLRSPFRTPD